MSKTSPVKTLFLDVGGVLLTNGWDRHSRALAVKTFSLDPDETESRHHLTFDTYEVGKLSLDEYLNRVIFYEKRNFSKDEFRQFMFEQSKPFPEMIEMVCDIKEKHGLKIAVVSNEGRELTEYRIKKFGLNVFVDFFISSCFVHLRKPDVDIFRLALDVSQTSPSQVVYIDDRNLFVQVAKKLDIQGIHHEDFQSTCIQLNSFFC